jgi:hypothetical protein
MLKERPRIGRAVRAAWDGRAATPFGKLSILTDGDRFILYFLVLNKRTAADSDPLSFLAVSAQLRRSYTRASGLQR